MTIVADCPPTVERLEVTAGVDTHADSHVAAVIDPLGRHLADRSFPATPVGYRALAAWIATFGIVARVGVEGTGAYGAGLARALAAADFEVVEIDRPDRKARRDQGKSDPIEPMPRPGPRPRAGRPGHPRPGLRELRLEPCGSLASGQ